MSDRKPMLGEHSRIEGERWSVWANCVYVVRDTFASDGKFAGCEYGSRLPDGGIAWKPCEEGCEFADVEPVAVLYR